MVERLRTAIQKARQSRQTGGTAGQGGGQGAGSGTPGAPGPETQAAQGATARPASDPWAGLEPLNSDPDRMTRSRIVTHDKSDLAHVPFDILRTRILRVCREQGWTRIAITSPTKGCGKTLVATNLSFSLARQSDLHTLLVDMDLRAPSVARTLGMANAPAMIDVLRGDVQPESVLRSAGPSLAVLANSRRVEDAAEQMQAERTAAVLDGLIDRMQPDIVLYDLPPLLLTDDVTGFLSMVDCALLIVAAGQTRPAEITECERIFEGQTNFLGVVLNKAEVAVQPYYEYGAEA